MLKSHYRIGQAVGISIQLLADGGVDINACEVFIKNNQLDIVKEVVDLITPEALKQHFSGKIPVSLNLFGKGVLIKQVAKLNEIDALSFAQILPNADINDFYVQHFTSGEHSFVAVIRRAEADRWIQAVSEMGFSTLMLSLGAFPVEHIARQVNVYDEALVFDGHVIQLNSEQQWVSYRYAAEERSSFPLKVGHSVIDEKLLLPYAGGFQLALSPDIELIAADVQEASIALIDKIANKRFKVNGFIALLVFFVLLLINFILFTTLSSANTKMTSSLSISAQNASDIQGTASQIAEKEARLKALGWDGGINKSILVDQLAALLPDGIQLSEVAINPVDGDVTRMQHSLTFCDRKIKVIGYSASILPVNEWIARAKTLKWLKSIQMDSYTLDRETNTGRFTIVIKY